MAAPSNQIVLMDATGAHTTVEEIISAHRQEAHRILADDEIGLVLYVGDLDIYSLTPQPYGEYLAEKVTQLTSTRYPVRLVRRQIGSKIVSITGDTVFVIRDGDKLRKVRAEKLEPGMILATGEKVYS